MSLTVTTLLIVAVVSILVAIAISRSILRAVDAVRQSLEAMGRGDLTVAANVNRSVPPRWRRRGQPDRRHHRADQ